MKNFSRDAGARIGEHPVIAGYEKGPEVKFTYDGLEVTGFEGEPVAAALKALGVMTHRYTVKSHEPRGVFCAIGRCTDCVMVVDGTPNVRTCMTPLKSGMSVRTQYGLEATPLKDDAGKGGR
jgi:predicted molibdopterin-dependent oxidoreductase YjgC